MQVSLKEKERERWEGEEEENKTTKQKKTKRTSTSDKVLTEHLWQVVQTCGSALLYCRGPQVLGWGHCSD